VMVVGLLILLRVRTPHRIPATDVY
jgi:hypothetical protein